MRILRQGARDFWMDLAMKDEGILCVFRIFHKPKPGRKIRSSDENHFRESDRSGGPEGWHLPDAVRDALSAAARRKKIPPAENRRGYSTYVRQ